MPLEKAKLIPIYDGEAPKIEFMFNPTEIKFNRSMAIEQARGSNTQSGNSKTSFKHPNPYQLTISKIILDTYEKGEGRSVLDALKPFTQAVAFAQQGNSSSTQRGNNSSKRPPVYLFAWGSNPYLKCFVKSCNFTLTMFLSDGTPVRAVVDLTLEQIDDKNSQPSQGTPEVSALLRQRNGRTILE